MDTRIVLRSQTFLKKKIDASYTDMTFISGEYFRDGCERFITAGNEDNGQDTVRVFNFKTHVCEKYIKHPIFTYSSVVVKSEPSFCWFDHYGRLFFHAIPSLKRIREYHLKPRNPIWRGICVSGNHIIFLMNPTYGGGLLIRLNWRKKKHVVFPKFHKNEVWSICQLKNNPEYVISAGGANIGDDSALYLWNWKSCKLGRKFDLVHKDRVVYMKSFVDKHFEEKIVSSSRDSLIIVWNVDGFAEKILEGVSEDGKVIEEGFYCFLMIKNSFMLVGGEKGSLFTADLRKGIIRKIKNEEHRDKIDQIFFTDFRKKTILTCGRDGEIRVLSLLINQDFNEDEDERIEFLIDYIFTREIRFVRSGNEYQITILPHYMMV